LALIKIKHHLFTLVINTRTKNIVNSSAKASVAFNLAELGIMAV